MEKTSQLYFFRRQCDAERMDTVGAQIAHGGMDEAVPGDGRLAGKGCGDDGQGVMAAFLAPGNGRVAVGTSTIRVGWVPGLTQSPVQEFGGGRHAGRTFLEGFDRHPVVGPRQRRDRLRPRSRRRRAKGIRRR